MKRGTRDDVLDFGSDDDDSNGVEPMDQDSDDSGEGEVFQQDWDFFPFHSHDWHSIKVFCSRILGNCYWDVNGLATCISQHQEKVGSCIKVGEQTAEALAVGALINLHMHSGQQWAKAIVKFVLSKFASTPAVAQIFTANQQRVGLMINERIINVPAALALPLHESLFEEVEEANRLQLTNNGTVRPYYDVDFLLFITLGFRETKATSEKKKRREKQSQLEWFHPEEELYCKYAAFFKEYPISAGDKASSWTFDDSIQQFKVIMLVPMKAVKSVLQEMGQMNFDE